MLGCKNVNKDEIVVIGQASNAKAGALVKSDADNKGYYIDGMDSWDEKIYGKQVKVWGKLKIE